MGTTKNHPRVLVIEDDRALETILDRVVHTVEPATHLDWVTDAEEGLLKVKNGIVEGQKSYDLIIADIFLEGKISGLEFWSACQVLCPETAVLIMSSMPVDCFLKSIGREEVSPPFLPKPFSVGELRQIIEGLMH